MGCGHHRVERLPSPPPPPPYVCMYGTFLHHVYSRDCSGQSKHSTTITYHVCPPFTQDPVQAVQINQSFNNHYLSCLCPPSLHVEPCPSRSSPKRLSWTHCSVETALVNQSFNHHHLSSCLSSTQDPVQAGLVQEDWAGRTVVLLRLSCLSPSLCVVPLFTRSPPLHT